MTDQVSSICSCHLGPGEWGDGGWHFHRLSLEALVAREERRAAEGLHAMSRADLQHYVNQPTAFEPCPHFVAKRRLWLEAERRKLTTSKGSRRSKLEE